MKTNYEQIVDVAKIGQHSAADMNAIFTIIKVNTKITKKGKIKITNLDNFLLYRIVKVFYFI